MGADAPNLQPLRTIMTKPLSRRQIGRTGLSVTSLGLGAAPLGNLYRPVTAAQAMETVEAALRAGLRYIDTAPYYGLGLSERRIGDAIRGRDDIVLSTKVGRVLEPAPHLDTHGERYGFVSPMPFEPVFDYTRDAILRSHEQSLERLGLARVDILYVHDIGGQTHGDRDPYYRSQLIDGGGLAALRQLREEGSVAAIGIGVNEIQVCLELMDQVELDVILLAGRYTLLEQNALDALFPRCLEAGTSIVVGGPFNSGVLATGSSGQSHYNYASAPEDVLERVRRLEEVCAAHGVPLPAAALRFPLAHPAVAAVIPGFASADEVRSGVNFYHFPIPDALWADLRNGGLIDPRAPLPMQSTKKETM